MQVSTRARSVFGAVAALAIAGFFTTTTGPFVRNDGSHTADFEPCVVFCIPPVEPELESPVSTLASELTLKGALGYPN